MGCDRVTVIGWFNKNNVGDEAYKLAYPLLFPGIDFVFEDSPGRIVGPAALGGGDIVTPLTLASLRAATGRKTVMSVTISKDHIREDFAGVSTVLVRDYDSLDRLTHAGVDAKLTPDLAFALIPDALAGKEAISKLFVAEGLELYDRIIAVVLNGYLLRPTTPRAAAAFEKVAFDLAEIMDTTPASFVFIPFGTTAQADDRVPSGWVSSKSKFWKKNLVVYDRLSPQEALNMVAACNAVISTRLHSSIFATLSGVPFVDLTHNHKNPAFLRTVGRESWAIPLAYMDLRSVKGLLDKFLVDPTERHRLMETSAAQKKLLHDAVSHVRLTG